MPVFGVMFCDEEVLPLCAIAFEHSTNSFSIDAGNDDVSPTKCHTPETNFIVESLWHNANCDRTDVHRTRTNQHNCKLGRLQ